MEKSTGEWRVFVQKVGARVYKISGNKIYIEIRVDVAPPPPQSLPLLGESVVDYLKFLSNYRVCLTIGGRPRHGWAADDGISWSGAVHTTCILGAPGGARMPYISVLIRGVGVL